jgi:predicted GNAT family N-acyltransferase
MHIRALTVKDIPAWLALAHEGDAAVSQLVPDISVFYHGFDEYMMDKISKLEAFMTVDELTGECLGIVAFSEKRNSISFIGVSKSADFQKVGGRLLEYTLNMLDNTLDITANVIKSVAPIIKQERALYARFGFTVSDDGIIEAGVPAVRMKLTPVKTGSVI